MTRRRWLLLAACLLVLALVAVVLWKLQGEVHYKLKHECGIECTPSCPHFCPSNTPVPPEKTEL